MKRGAEQLRFAQQGPAQPARDTVQGTIRDDDFLAGGANLWHTRELVLPVRSGARLGIATSTARWECRVIASARGLLGPLQRSIINPIVRAEWALGLGPPGDALLETTGRRTGQLRLTPICDCLDGDTGRRADYVRNITSNPRVRVKVRSGLRTRWLTGTAHILDDDDPKTRLRLLLGGNVVRALCLRAASAIVSDPDAAQVTVRVDLDSR